MIIQTRQARRPSRASALGATVAGLALAALCTSAAAPASASPWSQRHRAGGSVLLDETFQGSSIADPGFMPLDTVCLTGASGTPPAGESTTGPCTAADQTTPNVPPPGVTPGWLQLTDGGYYRVGGLLYNRPLPGNGGLQVIFDQYQYGGNGADGIGFFLVDGAVDLTEAGADGGSLGYAQRNLEPGVHGGYLGIGLDAYGNFANDAENRGMNCPTASKSPVISDYQVTDSVTLRGPGEGLDGYCFLDSTMTADSSKPSGFVTTLPGSLRADTTVPDGAARRVRLTVSPDPRPLVTVDIDFNDGNGYQRVLSYQMQDVAPATYKFGFSGSTGGLIDTHLIRNVVASSVDPLSTLNLVKTVATDLRGQRSATYRVGDTVNYNFLVTNTGSTALSGVAISDPRVVDAGCPRSTLGAMGSPTASMVCTGSHVITVDDSFTGEFTNTATAGATNPGGSNVVSNESSATVDVERLTPDLQITKTAEPHRTEPGGTVHYTVKISNAGSIPVSPADFTDDLSQVLDDADYNGDATATTGSVALVKQTLHWSGDLAVGATATVRYSVTVHDPDRGDGLLHNAVTGSIPGTSCTTATRALLPCTVDVPVDRPSPTPTPSASAPSAASPPSPAPGPTHAQAAPGASVPRPGGERHADLAATGIGSLLLLPGGLAVLAGGAMLLLIGRWGAARRRSELSETDPADE